MKIDGYDKEKGRNCFLTLRPEGVEITTKGIIGGVKGVELIRYTDIISANYVKGTLGLLSKIEIHTAGGKRKINNTPTASTPTFVNALNRRISDAKNPRSVYNASKQKPAMNYSPGQIPKDASNIAENKDSSKSENDDLKQQNSFEIIEKSKKLLDMGAITEEEYNKIKEKQLEKFLK